MNRPASRSPYSSAASGSYGAGAARADGVFDVAVVGMGAVGAAMALMSAQAGCRTAIIAPPPGGPAVNAGRAGAGSGGMGSGSVGSSGAGSRGADPAASPDNGGDDWDARVFALSPGSRDLLETLRVWSALDHSRIAPVYDMRIQAESPATAVQAPPVHFSAYQGQVDALAWIVEGRHLDRTLARALDFSPVQRIAGSVVAMPAAGSAGDADTRSLTLDNGGTVKARLVIGADGASSIVRRLAGIDEHIHDYRHTAVVANFACELPHQDCAYQWFGAPGVLALLPLPGNRCSLVWSAPAALADALMTLAPRALALRVTEACDGCFGMLEPITAARAFPLRRIDVASLIAERVALVGDAAHVVHPLAGQGMNLGFGDVAQWLPLLRDREPFRDAGDPLLLSRYQRSRREAILAMKAATDGLQRLFDPDELARLGPLASPMRHLRGAGWRIVAGSDWLRRQLIRAAAIQ